MPTERQAIDRLRREVEFNRDRSERQAEEAMVSVALSATRAIVEAPSYPAVVSDGGKP